VRLSFLVLLAGFSISLPAAAEEALPADMAERTKLAVELNDVMHIRDKITADIENYSRKIPSEQRDYYTRYIQLKVDYDKLEDLSVTYTAETFTVPELRAMLAYYGSSEGQSAEAKASGYQGKMSKDVQKEIDAALMAAKLSAPSK